MDIETKIETNVDFNVFKLFDANNKYKVFQRDKIEYKLDIKLNKICELKIISTQSNKLIISGVLEINSKIIYGYDNKKRPYKLFTPFNKLFPKFLIAYNCQNIECNKIISIKFKSWTIEYPIGEIVASFGYLDPKLSLKELASIYRQSLLFHGGFYSVKRIKNTYNVDTLKKIFNDTINKEQIDQPFHTIKKENDFLMICNIDPIGCTDIDDLISYSIGINGEKIIGVHICDLTYILHIFNEHYPEFSNDIYKNMFLNEIFATVYPGSEENKPYGILSDYLIDNFLTLKTDSKRYVWSIYYYIDPNTNKIINIEIKPEIIINKKTYTYDEVENILLSTDNLQSTNLYMKYIADFATDYGKEYYPNIYKTYDNHNYNSHYMISLFMTLTNHYIGKLLLNDNKTIYRSTCTLTEGQTEGPIYGIYNFNNATNYHSSIDINNYTHFTSPIRRFIDQYIHYKLYKYYFGDNCILNNSLAILNDINIKTINDSLSAMKIVGNQFKLLSLIKSDIENIYTCKLIDFNYDIDENKLYLKWLVNNEIKVYDSINNPLIKIEKNQDISSEIITLYNRLNSEMKSFVLIKNQIYILKINLLLLNNMKNIKIIISYFN